MKRSRLLPAFFILTLFAALVFSSPQPSVNAAPRHANLAALTQAVQVQGFVPVIVMLDGGFVPDSSLPDSSAVTAQHAALRQMQGAVLNRLAGGYDAATLKTYTFVPAMALLVDASGLAALAADPAVLSITPDGLVPPTLAESVPLIGAPAVWASGFSGQGQTIVVLDTGVDKTHPFLAGKVIAEACYSSNNFVDGSLSLCPGGVTSSTAANSAMPYASAVCPANKCDHGTHVAGIAAGKDPGGINATGFNGVAKDSNLIAIQIFSKLPANNSSCGNSDCVLSYYSDEISALQHVYDLRGSYPIAAVNMSLGGGQFTSACDDSVPALTAAINTLRGVGIATVIASGNAGLTSAISFPACISSAISVGAVTDGTAFSTASTPDVVASYSNAAPMLSLLAPGSIITSSLPGGGYGNKEGTSMATPHVAGAWAVLKSKFPNATVSDILTALVTTGKPITDLRAGAGSLVKPRIQLNLAAGLYSISGRVTLSGGFAVAGATLSDGLGHATLSDAQGNYTLSGLLAGSYTITPSKALYTGFSPANQLVVVAGNKTGIDFVGTTPLYSVTGTVTSDGKTGIAGVLIIDNLGRSALSAGNGTYTLSGLPAGSYTLFAVQTGLRFAPNSHPLTISANQPNIDFIGTAGGSWSFLPVMNK